MLAHKNSVHSLTLALIVVGVSLSVSLGMALVANQSGRFRGQSSGGSVGQGGDDAAPGSGHIYAVDGKDLSGWTLVGTRGAKLNMIVYMTNTGNTSWPYAGVPISEKYLLLSPQATLFNINEGSPFNINGGNPIFYVVQPPYKDISPNETAQFPFVANLPLEPEKSPDCTSNGDGSYQCTLSFQMSRGGVLFGTPLLLAAQVVAGGSGCQMASDEMLQTHTNPGESFVVSAKAWNSGSSSWDNTYSFLASGEAFSPGGSRATVQGTVPSQGGSQKFSFQGIAPSAPGMYLLTFQMHNPNKVSFGNACSSKLIVRGSTGIPDLSLQGGGGNAYNYPHPLFSSGLQAPIDRGVQTLFHYTVKNHGIGPSPNYTLVASFPSRHFNFISSRSTPECSVVADEVSCPVPPIIGGASAAFNLFFEGKSIIPCVQPVSVNLSAILKGGSGIPSIPLTKDSLDSYGRLVHVPAPSAKFDLTCPPPTYVAPPPYSSSSSAHSGTSVCYSNPCKGQGRWCKKSIVKTACRSSTCNTGPCTSSSSSKRAKLPECFSNRCLGVPRCRLPIVSVKCNSASCNQGKDCKKG